MEQIDVILFLAIVIIILGCWIIVLYARFSKRIETLEIYNQHLKDQRESLISYLNKKGISVTPSVFADTEQWGQKEFENYKSKQKS